MKFSKNGLDYLCAREAFRAEPYRDGSVWPSGRPRMAIGYGHTIPEGGEGEWGKLSRETARSLLDHDLVSRVAAVDALVHVPVTQHQFDALVSLVFNIGAGGLGSSTLLRLLNAGDYAGAAAEFDHWNKWRRAPGAPLEVSEGLTLRRKLDRELFETPDEVPLEELLARAFAAQFDIDELLELGPHHA